MAKVNAEERRAQLRRAALEYHEFPTPGKIAVTATKQLVNQHDLALAYTPGVAAPCEEIVKDPAAAFKYTSRGNLVGVVTNGTAVLGLGDIGPLASKPVMEGKAVLFKNSLASMYLTSRSMRKTPKSWLKSLRHSSPLLAALTSKTSKPPIVFMSSANCVSA